MKKKSALILAIGLSLLALFSQVAAEQKKAERHPGDTVFVDEYKILGYDIPFEGQDEYGTQYEIYLDNKLIITTPPWPFARIWFCGHNTGKTHLCDINGDGIKELVLQLYSGGNNGAVDVRVYHLNSTGNEIAYFDGLDKGEVILKDINNDSLPEFLFGDLHYDCWHYGCFGSPRPWLVYQWHEGKYRLANFHLGKDILKAWDKIDIDTFNAIHYCQNPDDKISKYDPTDEYGYPIELLRIMLEYIYCGYPEKARAVFDACWSDSVAGKEAFYKEVIDQVHSDKYWPQIEKSKW